MARRCDHSVWALQSRYFAHHGANVLAVDLPGHGRSGGPALHSVRAIADWIFALLDALGVERAALVGHSLGSLAVLDAGGRHRARVSKLALLATSVPMPVAESLLSAAKADDHARLRTHHRLELCRRAPLRRQCAARHVDDWQRAPPDGTDAAGRAATPTFAPVKITTAGSRRPQVVRCPVLVIAGQRDQMTPPRQAQKLIAALADKRVLTIPDCGHMLMTEAPDAVLDALRVVSGSRASRPSAAAIDTVSVLALTVHDDAAGFVAAAESFLRRSEAENSMIAMPAARMVSAPNDDDPGIYLATVTDSDTVVAAALHGGSGGVLLTAAPQAAVSADRSRYRRARPDADERGGPARGMRSLRARLARADGPGAHAGISPAPFRTDRQPGVRSRRRESCACPKPSEHDLIADWQIAFIEEVGLPDERARARRNVARRIERGLVRVWDHGGRCRVHRVRRRSGGNGPHRPGIYAAGLSWPRLCVGNGGRACRANCSPRARVRYF